MTLTAEAKLDYRPFRVSNDALAHGEELRRRVQEDGYLFLRGLVPADSILDVRRDTLELCQDAGWIKPGSDLMEAVVPDDLEPIKEGQPAYMGVYKKMLRLPSFAALPHHAELLDLAEKVLQGAVLVHPRRIGRITFPRNLKATTPPHQDFHYIRGASETYTIWIPLGDCPIHLGGLAVLQGSQRAGFVEHTVIVEGAVGGIGVDTERDFADVPHEWRCSDFGIGDVLLFHSHTVHKAMPNLTPDRIRLSTDNRYQRAADAIDPSSLGSHYNL